METKIPILPFVGSTIYVPTQLYLSRGRDDVQGGKAKVKSVEVKHGTMWVSVEELPGRSYNWAVLSRDQGELKARFGDQVARPDPDNDPDSNRWL